MPSTRVSSAPRPKPAPPKPKPKPSPRNTSTAGVGLLGAGAQLGTAFIGARALNDTLDKLTENPMLLAAVAGVAVIFLLR